MKAMLCVPQQAVQDLDQVRLHIRPTQVENQLAAAQTGCAGGEVDRPIWVGAVEIAVRADHFRLNPQPEVHAQGIDLGDQRSQPAGKLRLVRPPVTQTGGLIAPPMEPSVIHHEQLDAEPGGPPGKLGLRSLVHGEGGGLPGVIEDLVGDGAVGEQPLAHEVVHPPAGLTEAAIAISGVAGWGDELGARLQTPGEIPVVHPDANPRRFRLVRLYGELPGAAPGQGTEPDLAALLGGSLVECEPGAALVAGGQPPALGADDPTR